MEKITEQNMEKIGKRGRGKTIMKISTARKDQKGPMENQNEIEKKYKNVAIKPKNTKNNKKQFIISQDPSPPSKKKE